MNDERDDPLAALSVALEVEPSPEFAARVRTRIGEEPRSRLHSWSLVAAALAAAVLVMVWLRSSPAPDIEPSRIAEVPAAAPAVVSLPAPPRDAPAQIERTRVVQRERSRQLTARHEPEVLIAPDEAIAFQHLVRAVYGGRLVASEPVQVPVLLQGIEVRPLPFGEIAPIVLEPLDNGPVAAATSDREG